jgi:ribosome biogenesis GTPase
MTERLPGTVIKSTGSWSIVLLEDGSEIPCRLRGTYRIKGLRTTSPISVGDKVEVGVEPGEERTGSIEKIHERKNYIIRRSVNLSKEAHIIASNIDQALIIATVHHPRTSFGFIDRFLCVAEAYNIKAAVVINKMDLNRDKKSMILVSEYLACYDSIGYKTFTISALEETGLNQLLDWMKDKVTLISGHSGVGKSTLINCLIPELDLATGEISEMHSKGTHTTTFAEMFQLKGGGFLIDTPGIKEFGMVDMQNGEISHYFPEIFKASVHCRFNNCVHLNEPGCAVLAQTNEGHIPKSRYSSYLSILESLK